MSSSIVLLDTPYYTARQYPSEDNRVVVQIKGGVTDADASHHPSLRLEATGDQVKSYQVADEKGQKHWKDELGIYATHHIVKQAVEARGQEWTGNDRASTMLAFPEGYELFSRERARNQTRDIYLYGSRSVTRFSSPQEFAPHLGWLMLGKSAGMNGALGCNCKCCDRSVKQRAIRLQCDYFPDPRGTARPCAAPSGSGRAPRACRNPSGAPKNDIPYKDYSKLGQAGSGPAEAPK